MTYIEFFDKVASENICACLTFVPDRVIYIGNNSKLMRKHIANYERVFSGRGCDIAFEYRTVSKSNLENAVELLSKIVAEYDDCTFGITGGEEILTLALGVVYAQNPDKNIQIHKFNLEKNTIHDCDKDGKTIYHDVPTLSVEENVRIYGGDVMYGGVNDIETYKWDMNAAFLQDIRDIWDICKDKVRLWNVQVGILATAEEIGDVSEDGLTTTVSRLALEYRLSQNGHKYKKANGIITRLLKKGLLTCFDDSNDDTVTVGYKDPQVKRCLTKAGQALEMKIFAMAKGLADEDGKPVYNDAVNGVMIDWDGELHEEEDGSFDTKNEIDVLLMHDTIPVFISCKNGSATKDELYKLETVAQRFGGEYSQKVLIATEIDNRDHEGDYLRQRAEDMDIRIIENVHKMDDATLERKLRNLWQS